MAEQDPQADQPAEALKRILQSMQADPQYAALVRTYVEHNLEVYREQMIADVIRDFAVKELGVAKAQKSNIQMEVVPTVIATAFIIHLMLPGEQATRTLIINQMVDGWRVLPLPQTPNDGG